MTNENKLKERLNQLPKHMRTRAWIESEIWHEKHKGVHTYHHCECGRNPCRSYMCWQCWEELLEVCDGE